MTVRQLIRELQKMPQHLQVGTNNHDNYEHEVGGWCDSVYLLEKENYDHTSMDKDGRSMFDSLPKKCVVIRS